MRFLVFLLAFLAGPAQALSPSALYTITGGGQVTSWNPIDLSTGITLFGDNRTAVSNTVGSQGVRSNTSKLSGKYCAAVVASAISANWTAGFANATISLTIPAGLGTDANGIGYNPNSVGNNQGIFFNNVALSAVASAASSNGDVAMMCADFSAQLFWGTTTAMQANSGVGAWNNSGSCNPTNAACGLSFAGMSCPCFIMYNNINQAGTAIIGALPATMPYALPPGFLPWDSVGGL